MRKEVSLILLLFITSFAFQIGFVDSKTTVEYYYGLTCPHCINVAQSGVLEKLNETVPVTKYETWNNAQNADKFTNLMKELNVPSNMQGVPFLLINCDGKITYLVGDSPIIQNAQNYATTCNFDSIPSKGTDSSSGFNWWFALLFLVILLIILWFFTRNK